MRYREQGGTELQVRRETAQRMLWITMHGEPMTARGRLGEGGSLSWYAKGPQAEEFLREMVMIAGLWGVAADVEASR